MNQAHEPATEKTCTKIHKKTGPKPRVLDLIQVEELGKIHCTKVEAAAILRVPLRTFHLMFERDESLRKAWELGLSEGKKKLRKVQWDVATLDKNVTMLIWLGKQCLDQFESPIDEKIRVELGELRKEFADAKRKAKSEQSGNCSDEIEYSSDIQPDCPDDGVV